MARRGRKKIKDSGPRDHRLYTLEFQFGEGPHDPEADHYTLPVAREEFFPGISKPAGDVTRTAIGSLGLKPDQAFWYWFDFGDDWWHQIKVVAMEDKATKGKYPKVTKRVGKSPPQYVDWDEEDEFWDEDEDD